MNLDSAMLPADMEQLSRLRHAIAKSEALPEEVRPLALGVTDIDTALGGGLTRAALHEVSAISIASCGAAGSVRYETGEPPGEVRFLAFLPLCGESLRPCAICSELAWRQRRELRACPCASMIVGALCRQRLTMFALVCASWALIDVLFRAWPRTRTACCRSRKH